MPSISLLHANASRQVSHKYLERNVASGVDRTFAFIQIHRKLGEHSLVKKQAQIGTGLLRTAGVVSVIIVYFLEILLKVESRVEMLTVNQK